MEDSSEKIVKTVTLKKYTNEVIIAYALHINNSSLISNDQPQANPLTASLILLKPYSIS